MRRNSTPSVLRGGVACGGSIWRMANGVGGVITVSTDESVRCDEISGKIIALASAVSNVARLLARRAPSLRGQARYRIERTTLAFRRRHSSRTVGAMLLDAVHLPLTGRKTDCRRGIAEATRRARPLRRGLLEQQYRRGAGRHRHDDGRGQQPSPPGGFQMWAGGLVGKGRAGVYEGATHCRLA